MLCISTFRVNAECFATEGVNCFRLSYKQFEMAHVTRDCAHPLEPDSIPVYGYNYDVKTGLLNEVPEIIQPRQRRGNRSSFAA